MAKRIASALLVIGLVGGLEYGCLTSQQRDDLAVAKARVTILESAVNGLRTSGAASEAIVRAEADLAKAKSALAGVQAEQLNDRVNRGLDFGQGVLGTFGPILSFAFPGIGGVLGLIAAAFAGMKSVQASRLPKKD